MNRRLLRNRWSLGPALWGLALCLGLALWPAAAPAFCGFYVAKADARLFNRASQVVLVRDGDRTVLTMANDYRGDPKEFALVVPVPTFLKREQIRVADKAVLDHLDAYSAPRLVEYYDDDPCRPPVAFMSSQAHVRGGRAGDARARSLGVTVEARYTVGEYDIVILSAKESSGLATWLQENGYRIPPGAGPVLRSYLKQGTRFFVAKVNLEEQSKLGFSYLRPLQIDFTSPKFMLPIRLGTVNADGPQELYVYTLTRKGRVETTNYRTVKLPTDVEVPLFVKAEFPRFYRDLFRRQVREENGQAVFVEYAWDMNWCDPCAADPLTAEELKNLGVFWLAEGGGAGKDLRFRGGAQEVFVTRLHLRYDRAHFPADLVFQETGDRTNFQARYVLRHPWKGEASCKEARQYRRELAKRQARDAQTLASLTGWELQSVRRRMAAYVEPAGASEHGGR